jgi:acyl carrier protein
MHPEPEIRRFLVDTFLFGRDDATLTETSSLLGGRILDSTGVLELVAFLEERWGVRVEDAELVPANFDSIASLARLVRSKLGQVVA